MRVVEVKQNLGDDAEDFRIRFSQLDFALGQFEPSVEVDSVKGGVVIMLANILFDYFQHRCATVTVLATE